MSKSGLNNRKVKTLISLFSGAGGLDIGLAEAGFDVRLCVEIDEDAQETIRINHPGWALASPGDIHELTPENILRQAGLKPKELTLLAGGPPCQPFSKSGYWASGDSARLDDPRSNTLAAYLSVVGEALPEILLIENVKGINFKNKNEGMCYLLEGLGEINQISGVKYSPQIFNLNAADYGVPQLRERVFIIAHREGLEFQLPKPTHMSDEELSFTTSADHHRTVWDAIGDLDSAVWSEDLNIQGKWQDLLPSIPEGQNYQWHTERSGGKSIFGWRTRFWSFLLKLSKNKPSWTIQAQPGPATGPFHWKSRQLSIRELARIQTFPDHIEFSGSRRSAIKQIGNAVPPAIGELFGLEFCRQFFKENVRTTLQLIPKKRKDCPGPERCKPVPLKYLDLIGEYADHPGTGKGPGAVLRK
ncbi:DNA cytosine methyltransferase [Pseudomonas pergaminensis]|uniref:DNA (cytosine-5-)-methyltransferase n=1 Tax=Pseudomonas pergaminensis TaxID=2853159 RepID=A0ABW8QYP8_9PSED